MLTCLAAAFTILTVSTTDLGVLTREVEADAEALLVMEPTDQAFPAAMEDFAIDAMALSDALRAADAPDDLPCIFKGISEDARTRGARLAAATDPMERQMTTAELRALFSDAALLAPLAAEALGVAD